MSNLIYRNLVSVLSFTEKDVNANKRLSLTEKQKHRIRPKIEIHVSLSFLLTTICFFAVFGLLNLGNSSYLTLFLTFLCSAGFGLSFYWAVRSVQRVNRLKSYSGVKFVEGRANFRVIYLPDLFNPDRDAKIQVFTMNVGKIRIYLDKATFYSMNDGEYRVYYFQALRKIILSVENIG